MIVGFKKEKKKIKEQTKFWHSQPPVRPVIRLFGQGKLIDLSSPRPEEKFLFIARHVTDEFPGVPAIRRK